jgi:hypothetical protein
MSRTTIFSDADLSAGSAAVPHRRHSAASAEPHWLQNSRPSRLSAPHFAHRTSHLSSDQVTAVFRQSATQRQASNLRKEHVGLPPFCGQGSMEGLESKWKLQRYELPGPASRVRRTRLKNQSGKLPSRIVQLLEQHLGVLQVGGVEAFGEPT